MLNNVSEVVIEVVLAFELVAVRLHLGLLMSYVALEHRAHITSKHQPDSLPYFLHFDFPTYL